MARPVRLVFPHQLFAEHFKADSSTIMILVEDDLFFRQYKFHKQKLMLHRASLRQFADELKDHGFTVEIIETDAQKKSAAQLSRLIKTLEPSDVSYFDLVDDWLDQSVTRTLKPYESSRLVSPGFVTTPGDIETYFEDNPDRMQHFYEWQRKRLGILVENGKPVGGKWSFDAANRKKLPKQIELPPPYSTPSSKHADEARTWVDTHFAGNPGTSQNFRYPLTHTDARAWLTTFLKDRLEQFGPYEDAISSQHGELFHSLLSPLLNIGLLTPEEVVKKALHHAETHTVPIESLEGFIRQIIGWREYMRATYVRYGRAMRTSNHLEFSRRLDKRWWNGSVGLAPIDDVIGRVLETAYAHHIERLMILGNSLVLLRIHPDDVYEWFMSLFIDAYDWVMVPNVYAMSQFAAGDRITTKPYVSGSNYIRKMSDYGRGDWADTWDALYWTFINDYREMVENNYRSKMVVRLYDNFDPAKKAAFTREARAWLA